MPSFLLFTRAANKVNRQITQLETGHVNGSKKRAAAILAGLKAADRLYARTYAFDVPEATELCDQIDTMKARLRAESDYDSERRHAPAMPVAKPAWMFA